MSPTDVGLEYAWMHVHCTAPDGRVGSYLADAAGTPLTEVHRDLVSLYRAIRPLGWVAAGTTGDPWRYARPAAGR